MIKGILEQMGHLSGWGKRYVSEWFRAGRWPFCSVHVLRARSEHQHNWVTLRDEPGAARPAGSSRKVLAFPSIPFRTDFFDDSPWPLMSIVPGALPCNEREI